MKAKVLILAGVAASALGGQALAHHSFAMFDPDKLITQEGVVKEFEWTNPHVWLHIVAPDAGGKAQTWSFEMQAVAAATSGGWRANTVKPGDKVAVEGGPFGDFIAEVASVGESRRVEVLHSLFGRLTRLKIDLARVRRAGEGA